MEQGCQKLVFNQVVNVYGEQRKDRVIDRHWENKYPDAYRAHFQTSFGSMESLHIANWSCHFTA
jgi:hypothetical protein